MIIDQAVYRQGRRHDCGALADELAALRSSGEGYIWIGLKDPTPEEFEEVQTALGLHDLAVEDALQGGQRPKLEVYEHGLFVVMKTLRYIEATSDVETGEVMVFVGDQFVVTVRQGEANPLADVRTRLEGHPDRLEHGPIAVLYSVMDSVVDVYTDIDTELSIDLAQLESQVFADGINVDAQDIYRLKREVIETRRGAGPLQMPLRRIVSGEIPRVPEQSRPFFRDILDHTVQVVEHVESYDRLLSDMMSVHLSQVSVQQNDDMRKISAWVAMAAVPTLIAGIYGMNFVDMPELNEPWGYPMALSLMAAIIAFLVWRFKRSGWL